MLEDLTGGFNYGSGAVELQLPNDERGAAARRQAAALAALPHRRADRVRRRAGASYTHAPEIYSITAAPIGALLPAAHSARVEGEALGTSDGTPGQPSSCA